MKKIFIVSLTLSLLFVGTAFAHTGASASVNTNNTTGSNSNADVSVNTFKLPSAGITPDSPFYFLDRFAENVQEFFTFNPEDKAKLQIQFAGERVAEIKALVKNDALNQKEKSIEKAKGLLMANVAEAATIIKTEKNKGKDVTQLANEINTSFNTQEQLLVQTFQDARKKLNQDRNKLLAQSGAPIQKQVNKTTKTNANAASTDSVDAQARDLAKEAANLKGIQNDIQTLFGDNQKAIVNELSPKDKKVHEKRVAKEKEKNVKEEKNIEKVEIENEKESNGSSNENKSENKNENSNENQGENKSENNRQGESEGNSVGEQRTNVGGNYQNSGENGDGGGNYSNSGSRRNGGEGGDGVNGEGGSTNGGGEGE